MILYSRDSIQDPFSLEFALRLLRSTANTLQTFYWMTYLPLVVPRKETMYTTAEKTYSMRPCGIEGWVEVTVTLQG